MIEIEINFVAMVSEVIKKSMIIIIKLKQLSIKRKIGFTFILYFFNKYNRLQPKHKTAYRNAEVQLCIC